MILPMSAAPLILAEGLTPLLVRGQSVVFVDSTTVREAAPDEKPIGQVVRPDADGRHALVRLFDPLPCANVYQASPLRRVETCCHHCGGERWARSEGQPTACYYCGTERRCS